MRMCARVSTVYRRLENDGLNVHPDAMSARSMCAVMRELGVSKHTRLVSLGASDGRAMLSAAMLGVRHAVGYERSDVAHVYRQTFEAARALLMLHASRYTLSYEYTPRKRFSNLLAIPTGTTTVHVSWWRLEDDEKRHTLRLVAECPTVVSVCVVLIASDPDPETMLATYGRRATSITEIYYATNSAAIVIRF